MRWLVRLAASLAVLVAACGPSPEPPAQHEVRVPQLQGRVNDYANVLSPDQEAALTRRLEAIETGTPHHDQVVILTVASLEGNDIKLYANTVARTWRLGQAEYNNGMLVVLSLDPRSIRFETAGGVQDRMTDARGFLIQRRQMIPHLQAGEENYFAALDAGTAATQAVLMGESSGDEAIDSGHDSSVRTAHQRASLPTLPPTVWFVLIVGGLVTLLLGFANGWFSPATGAITGAVAAGVGGAFALPALAAGAGIGLVIGGIVGLLAYGLRTGAIDPGVLFYLFSGGGGGSGGGGFSGGGGGDFDGGGSDSSF